MKDYHYKIEMDVRDYECDIQGIVNNSVYQNYLEHCRHKFLNSVNLSFSELHNQGIDAVVTRAELKYKNSLKPEDSFYIYLKMRKKGHLRIIFDQEIVRKEDHKLMVVGEVDVVLVQNNRPISPAIIEGQFKSAGVIF